jgi:hypothetical protein
LKANSGAVQTESNGMERQGGHMLNPDKPFFFRGREELAILNQRRRRISHVRKTEDAHGEVG